MPNTSVAQSSNLGWATAKSALEIAVILLVLVVMRIYATPYLQGEALQTFTASFGLLAPLVSMLISAVVVMTPVPTILAIVPGSLVFGAAAGASYAVVGMTAGACLSFLIGRYCIRGIALKIKRQQFLKKRLERVDELLERRGVLGVIALRLAFFSSIIFNHVAGVTPVTLRDFCLGTFIGLIPRTFILAYLFGVLGTTAPRGNPLLNPDVLLLMIFASIRIYGLVMLALLVRSYGGEIERGPCRGHTPQSGRADVPGGCPDVLC